MNDREEVKQRVQYLIEHGGIYPEDHRNKPWPKWVWLLVAIGVVGLVAEIFR